MKSYIFPLLLIVTSTCVVAGPYEPAAGLSGSTAISKDSGNIAGWATSVAAYQPGAFAQSPFNDSSAALGHAEGVVTSGVVSLGLNGSITLTFAGEIYNGEGWDFAIFENGFDDDFLELARVQVSSDGINFVEFPGISITANPVGTYSTLDTTNIANNITNSETQESWNTGYAGKYRAGWGTPFDLDWFVATGQNGVDIDVDSVTHIRIIDINGDGSFKDIFNNPVYDPSPLASPGGGFDLDGVGVRYIQSTPAVSVPIPIYAQFFLLMALLLAMKKYSSRPQDVHITKNL